MELKQPWNILMLAPNLIFTPLLSRLVVSYLWKRMLRLDVGRRLSSWWSVKMWRYAFDFHIFIIIWLNRVRCWLFSYEGFGRVKKLGETLQDFQLEHSGNWKLWWTCSNEWIIIALETILSPCDLAFKVNPLTHEFVVGR